LWDLANEQVGEHVPLTIAIETLTQASTEVSDGYLQDITEEGADRIFDDLATKGMRRKPRASARGGNQIRSNGSALDLYKGGS